MSLMAARSFASKWASYGDEAAARSLRSTENQAQYEIEQQQAQHDQKTKEIMDYADSEYSQLMQNDNLKLINYQQNIKPYNLN